MDQTALPLISHVGANFSPEDSARQALETFDALRPGEWMSLVFNRAPRGLLSRFQQEKKGQFDWTPTLEGPETWKMEISRRTAEPGSLREVNEALSWDHDRLDDLESRAFKARDRADFAEAKALYATFAFGLRRHIRFEEEILFPEFEARLGLSSTMGPSAVMRDEHREILEFLNQIEMAIGDPTANVESMRHGLHSVLGNHNLKEENIVYPGTDQAMTPAERDTLVARIQAI